VSRPADVFSDLMHPERLLADPRATGQGVRVCVIDSGVDRARLAARCEARGQTLLPVEGALFRNADTAPQPDPGQPSNPHGTTVADILLTIAPRVQLFSADVFGPQGSCDVRVLIRAMRHAMDVWGCHIINLSLGVVEQRLQPVQTRLELLRTVEEAYYRDVLVVAAAHNDHPVTRSYPAVFAAPLLSVGRGEFADPTDFAYDLRDQIEFRAHSLAYFGPLASTPATSWAAPHLAGIAARILSLNPGLKPFEMKAILYWIQRARRDV
jgi:subtilisin